MDARYFREKAEVLFRLADGLSSNNPGRFQLMALAEDLGRRAKELEAQVTLTTTTIRLASERRYIIE
jgi:hypothetical protein